MDYVKGVVTIGSPFSLKESTLLLSKKSNYVYGMGMTKSLVRIALRYKTLCEEHKIPIDWGKHAYEILIG